VALDPEHRLVLCVVPGRRTTESVKAVVTDTQRRTGGRTMRLITTDEYPAYEAAILDAYGVTVTPPRTGKPGRPKGSYKVPPPGLRYATVVKTRRKGRVVKVEFRAVFGSAVSVRAALMTSPVSRAINTAFIERQNGTDRHRNARKGRKTYTGPALPRALTLTWRTLRGLDSSPVGGGPPFFSACARGRGPPRRDYPCHPMP
jgi:IS1 family transposase